MSLIITIYGDEGIVMAGDSRATYNGQRVEGGKIIKDFGIHFTESVNKVYMAPNNVGISACNDFSFNGKALAGYLQSFIVGELNPEVLPSAVPEKLLHFVQELEPVPNILFHVAGYEKIEGVFKPCVWRVYPQENKIEELDTDAPGACWNGENDVLSRLINPVYIKDINGEIQEVKTPPIPWNLYTLQDAVDFSSFAISTTMDTMRFQLRPKTVGGPIDILVLKPNESFWVQKKTLEVKGR
ncbi:MAG: hypothetical protein RR992_04005 [Clostridiales bacterium]